VEELAASPELVLVAPPELAAAARLAWPERPWERFVPARTAASLPPLDRPRRRPLPRRSPALDGRRVGLTAGAVLVVIATSLVFSGVTNRPAAGTSAAPSGPRPGGGYVAAARGLRASFRVDPDAARLVSIEVTSSCGNIEVDAVPLNAAGGFGYTSTGARTIELAGTFTGSDEARGTLRVAAPGCDTGRVPLVFRLS
jgi:hypothetical protein